MTEILLTEEQQAFLRTLFAKGKPTVVPTHKNGIPYLPGIVFKPISDPEDQARFIAILEKGAGFETSLHHGPWEDPDTHQVYDEVTRVGIRSKSLEAAMPYMPHEVQIVWNSEANAYWASIGGKPTASPAPVMPPHKNQPGDGRVSTEELVHTVRTLLRNRPV